MHDDILVDFGIVAFDLAVVSTLLLLETIRRRLARRIQTDNKLFPDRKIRATTAA
jgi:hypothetical protein